MGIRKPEEDDLCRDMAKARRTGLTYAELRDQFADQYTGKLDYPTTGWAKKKVKKGLRLEAQPTDSEKYQAIAGGEPLPEPCEGEPPLAWPSIVFGVDPEPDEPVFEYTGQLELTGDFIVVGDIHVPSTDWQLAERMLEVAQCHLTAPRQLLIAGDLLNMDALARFPKRAPTPKLRMELRAANRFIKRMLDVFDYVYAFLGNHDAWFLYALQGVLDIRQFSRLITDAYEKITFSPYSDAYITSGGERWYIPHQTNYRQTKLSVGQDLAAITRANVITTHQHHSAVGRDRGDNATIVDCGGLHEPTQMAYVQLNPSTRPKPTKGFVLLRGGCAHLLTPYPTMTDWTMWLPAAARRKAA